MNLLQIATRLVKSDYSDKAQGEIITRERAMKELRDHGMGAEEVQEFLEEVGNLPTYDAGKVLEWLGY
jgi:hypothetical protein